MLLFTDRIGSEIWAICEPFERDAMPHFCDYPPHCEAVYKQPFGMLQTAWEWESWTKAQYMDCSTGCFCSDSVIYLDMSLPNQHYVSTSFISFFHPLALENGQQFVWG